MELIYISLKACDQHGRVQRFMIKEINQTLPGKDKNFCLQ